MKRAAIIIGAVGGMVVFGLIAGAIWTDGGNSLSQKLALTGLFFAFAIGGFLAIVFADELS